MKKLVAQYDIMLKSPIIVKRPDDDRMHYQVHIDGFDIEAELIEDKSQSKRKKHERNWLRACHDIRLIVSRPDVAPPNPRYTDNGRTDYTTQASYFRKRIDEFEKPAITAIDRILRFCAFRLWHPLLLEGISNPDALQNLKWTDENWNEVGKAPGVLSVRGIPGIDGIELGTVPLQKQHDTRLQKALERPVEPELWDELLYYSQQALHLGNYKRAVLEMAIASETMTKTHMFGNQTNAAAVFSYLEDKRNLNLPITELLHKVAEEAFGESFKTYDAKAYYSIDHLFRCRNKVAHRGLLAYWDDSNNRQGVDSAKLRGWWYSCRKLQAWLRKKG